MKEWCGLDVGRRERLLYFLSSIDCCENMLSNIIKSSFRSWTCRFGCLVMLRSVSEHERPKIGRAESLALENAT